MSSRRGGQSTGDSDDTAAPGHQQGHQDSYKEGDRRSRARQALMSIKSLMVLSTDRARQKALIVSLLAVVLIVLPFVWSSFADDDFCESDMAMDMHMYGFKSIFSDETSCIMLFFSSWNLNTKIKFCFACLGVCVLGVVTESMSWVRRELSPSKGKDANDLTLWDEYFVSSMYVIQLMLGYLLMLVVMTYQIELIVYALVGVFFAHFTLNVRVSAASGGQFDPCCIAKESPYDDGTASNGEGATNGRPADQSTPLLG